MTLYVECKKCKSLYKSKETCNNCANNRKRILAAKDAENIAKHWDKEFATYTVVEPQCDGPEHPCKLIQSTILNDITRLKHDPVPNVRISSAQQDVVTAALAKFEERLSTGLRQGYFVGDGTGTGKGRTICATMIGFGQPKNIWVSASGDLLEDARRDMTDVTNTPMKIFSVYDTKYPTEGILFTTYTGLVKRYKQITKWFGVKTTGLIAFDECHKAKGVSQTNKSVVNLQQQLSETAVLYLSATGCSQYKHLTYMTRLGVFESIDYDIKKYTNSVSLSEVLAIELSHLGAYSSRMVSMDDVTFDVQEVKLTDADKHRYDQFVKAVALLPSGSRTVSMLIMKYVIMSLKIRHTVAIIRKALTDGYAVVVSLTSTGESHIDANNKITDSAKVLLNRVGNKEISDLIDGLEDIMNPLDTIVNEFGVDNVAELTGRTHRWVGDKLVTTPDRLADKHAFLDGEKNIAIISEASAAGISLHASPVFKNQKRRFHLVFELPWSVEQFSQQCGRTHRSNQLSAPHYVYVVTDLPGEIRYTSSIVRRLKMMGAITMGNRDCGKFMGGTGKGNKEGVDTFDFENKCGRLAAKDAGNEFEFSGNSGIEGFFNELIRKPVSLQYDVMAYFERRFEVHREEAQMAGTYDIGVREIKATGVEPVRETGVGGITVVEFDVYNHAPLDKLSGGEFGLVGGKTLIYRVGDKYVQPWRMQYKRKVFPTFIPIEEAEGKRLWATALEDTRDKYVKPMALVTGCVLGIVPDVKSVIGGPIRVKRVKCGDKYSVGIALESANDIRVFKQMFGLH